MEIDIAFRLMVAFVGAVVVFWAMTRVINHEEARYVEAMTSLITNRERMFNVCVQAGCFEMANEILQHIIDLRTQLTVFRKR